MIMSLLYSSDLRTFVSIGSFWCSSLERSVSQKGTYKYKLYTELTDMLNTFAALILGTKVSPYSALKYLHHEAEQRTCQGGVPSTFGALVADEGVLGLYLQELKWN
jgi:hypothetical protein